MEERLHKIIARAGVASRRRAEQLIAAGLVTVNGRVITEPGSRADAERDHIKVSGKLIRQPGARLYVALNKPAGCVCALSDPGGRESLAGFLRGVTARVFPVAQLGFHAQGLVLLTNDGELTNRLMQHADRLPQAYWVKIRGRLSEVERRQAQERTGARIRLMKDAPNAWYEMAFSGWRGRQPVEVSYERLHGELGHPVEKIRRTRLANLELGELPPGQYRYLTKEELQVFRRELSRVAGEEALRGPVRGEGREIQPRRQDAEKAGRRSAADSRGGRYGRGR